MPGDGGGGEAGDVGGLQSVSRLLAVLTAGLGVAIVVATARAGGGIGYLFGALFIAVGAGRLYLSRRRRSP